MLINPFQPRSAYNAHFNLGKIVSRKNQIARLVIVVALQKNVRDPFCETAGTIEHFILPLSHKSEYVNFDKL